MADNALYLRVGAGVGVPPAGETVLFADTDGSLQLLRSDGTRTPVTGHSTSRTVTDLRASDFVVRDIPIDNGYAWEVYENTDEANSVIGGVGSLFGDGGFFQTHVITPGETGFSRLAGTGVASVETPGAETQFLNPQSSPFYLRCRFALAYPTTSFDAILWAVRIKRVAGAGANIGIAYSGVKQCLEIRAESGFGSIREYSIAWTPDHNFHDVELFSDGAQVAVRLDGVWATLTDVTTTGDLNAGATGTSLPLPLEAPSYASFVDWGMDNIDDGSNGLSIYHTGPIGYGYSPRLLGGVG